MVKRRGIIGPKNLRYTNNVISLHYVYQPSGTRSASKMRTGLREDGDSIFSSKMLAIRASNKLSRPITMFYNPVSGGNSGENIFIL